jgi:hypothetical protein
MNFFYKKYLPLDNDKRISYIVIKLSRTDINNEKITDQYQIAVRDWGIMSRELIWVNAIMAKNRRI